MINSIITYTLIGFVAGLYNRIPSFKVIARCKNKESRISMYVEYIENLLAIFYDTVSWPRFMVNKDK